METLRTGRPYLEAVYIFNVMHKKVSELNYVYPYFLGGGKNKKNIENFDFKFNLHSQ